MYLLLLPASTLGKDLCSSLLSCEPLEDAEAPIYLNPETARAAHASQMVALRQLEIEPELGLCFPNTKTSNAMAFLNLPTACLPARRAPFMAGT
jgi:hypothetical protein